MNVSKHGALVLSLFITVWSLVGGREAAANTKGPNILIIYIDDLGYADLSATGQKAFATPHCDSIARNGVRFSNSYVTACVCSPSRAGLMTGRYQQRFGFDANAEGEPRSNRAPRGLDLKQTTFAQRFKSLGYTTGLVGKWHLGAAEGYLPTQRGFDEFYGLLPHGIGGKKEEAVPIYRGTEKVAAPAEHTVAFGKEAEAFIDRHRQNPFFLYLAFTAVHAPHSAPESYVSKFASLGRQKAAHYGMIACMDDAVGGVLAKLRELKLEENTLIFLASDNGGPANETNSNGQYRSGKWTVWEGGIRSPIFIQWKGRIPGGREIPHMVNQLDWLPTALAAAGTEVKPEWQLDGVNLLPLLEGKSTQAPHDALFWRFGVQYAVRQGDWKLVKPSVNSQPKLFNLANDVGEKNDLAAKEPEKTKQLQALWDAWNAKNEAPRWTDERWNGLEEKAESKKAKKGKKK
jgi:arylsulfatase A-like enzyme